MLGRITAAAVISGAAIGGGGAGAPITQPAHVDLSLLSADGPLSGSDTAIIVGATGIPTPTDQYAQSAENLYLHPLGFDGGATDSAVCHMDGTDPCSATLQVLTTPETTRWDQSMATGAADITQAVEKEFSEHPGAFNAEHPLTIFAYSQGASDSSIAMTQLAQDGIPSDALHFVFIGDPNDQLGELTNAGQDTTAQYGPYVAQLEAHLADVQNVVAPNPGAPTPDELYPVTNYTLDGDGFADYQTDYEAGGMSAVISGILNQHIEYFGLTPQQIADTTTTTTGDITQVNISDADVDNTVAVTQGAQGIGGLDAELHFLANLAQDFLANPLSFLI